MDIIRYHSVEFVTFQLHSKAKKLWRAYMEFHSLVCLHSHYLYFIPYFWKSIYLVLFITTRRMSFWPLSRETCLLQHMRPYLSVHMCNVHLSNFSYDYLCSPLRIIHSFPRSFMTCLDRWFSLLGSSISFQNQFLFQKAFLVPNGNQEKPLVK